MSTSHTLVERIDQTIADLQHERDVRDEAIRGLRQTRRQLMNGSSPSTPARRRRRTGTVPPTGPRTELLVGLLQKANRPMSVDELLEASEDMGRPDDRKLVRATLAYLKQEKRVQMPEHGMWEAAA